MPSFTFNFVHIHDEMGDNATNGSKGTIIFADSKEY